MSSKSTIEDAVALGHADVLAGRVSPRQRVAGAAGVPVPVGADVTALRAVVWSDTARDVFLAEIAALEKADPAGARLAAASIDRVAEGLGNAAVGVNGRRPHTWEKAVPDLSYLLVFELVTWTKAGEVIAIDALVAEPGKLSEEITLF